MALLLALRNAVPWRAHVQIRLLLQAQLLAWLPQSLNVLDIASILEATNLCDGFSVLDQLLIGRLPRTRRAQQLLIRQAVDLDWLLAFLHGIQKFTVPVFLGSLREFDWSNGLIILLDALLPLDLVLTALLVRLVLFG